jgi:competence protein ComEC
VLKLKRTTVITIVCGAFLVGLVLGRQAYWQVGWYTAALPFLVCLLAYRSRLMPVLIIVAALSLGIWRGQTSLQTYAELARLTDHKVTLVGEISDDPARGESGFVGFTIGHLRADGHPLAGNVRVTTYVSGLKRGYLVESTGRLQPARSLSQAQMFGQVSVRSRSLSGLEQWRGRFFAGMYSALPEPLAPLALGLLVGVRALIPKSVQAQLTVVGLSHLVAVSGYNLTILINAAYGSLKGWSRRLAMLTAFWLIAGFLLVSGFGASITRAAVVSILSLLASYYGRNFKPLTLIAIVAALTAGFAPNYLTDLGWQLSFLGFAGIIVAAPLIEQRWIKNPNVVKRLLIETLAAQILTLPLIMFTFGRLSLVAPLANVLVMPLVPAAMLLSLVAGLAGMLIPAAAGWMAWPAALILNLILSLVQLLAHWSWSSLNIQMTLPAALGWYLTMGLILITMTRVIQRRLAG